MGFKQRRGLTSPAQGPTRGGEVHVGLLTPKAAVFPGGPLLPVTQGPKCWCGFLAPTPPH